MKEIKKTGDLKRIDLNKDKRIVLNIDDILIHPNNPRFCKHVNEFISDDKIGDPEIQEETYRRMIIDINFGVSELASSIKARGYVPVDNIFVRKINGKYVCEEGNRRITAVKLLLTKHKEGRKEDDILSDDVLKTITKIECYDLTKSSVHDRRQILGLRHQGSLKPWPLLPSSFDIYNEYMKVYCEETGSENKEDNFSYDARIAKIIARINSISLSEVRNKLRTYRAYLQLKGLTDDSELEKNFSIIWDTTKDPTLREWLNFDDIAFLFSDEGAEKFIDLVCGKDDKEPVITAAASGESSLRDLSYVISNGTDEDVKRIVEDREKSSTVKADVKVRETERTLQSSLESALSELSKIKIGEDFGGLGDKEEELLEEIEKVINKIKALKETESGKK